MQQKILLTPFLLIAATFIGIGDTLYLSYEKLNGVIPSCAILNGCERVLTSVYSNVFTVPLAYIGLVFYVYMLAGAVLLAIDPHSKGLRFGMLAYTSIGLLCSIGFELFQYVVIGALCMYCAISALTSLVLFVLALWHWKASRGGTV
jgi:uncharacterized membrane protein